MPEPSSPREITALTPPDAQSADPSAEVSSRDSVGEPTVEPTTQPYRPSEPERYETIWVPVPARRVRNRVWLHVLLFLATVLTTTFIGVGHWLNWVADYRPIRALPPLSFLFSKGFWYSGTILTILGAHELGHYFACRYYRIDASLPYFLPVPPPVMTGTLGAFIRIRQPIAAKRALFDIGIAGPLAGFVFLVPALFYGIQLSHVARVPPHFSGLELGEPLLFKIASWMTWGAIPDGYSLNLHPVAFAAWFGLLATALNLLPIGQLDGGHISYAVFKRHSTTVTYVALAALVALNAVLALVYGTPALLIFTILIVVMLYVFGPNHPRVLDEPVPLDRTRLVLAVIALVVFVLCFTPVPIRDI